MVVGFNLPLMQQMTGINGLVTQAGQIMMEINQTLGTFTPFIINVVQLIATGFASMLLKRMGRKTNILLGNFCLGINDIVLAVLFLVTVYVGESIAISVVILVFLIIYMIIYGITIGPTVWSYVPEILPPKFVPFATMTNWIGCSVCVLFLPVVSN